MCDVIDCILHLLLKISRTAKQIQKHAEFGVMVEKEIALDDTHSHANLAKEDVAYPCLQQDIGLLSNSPIVQSRIM
jgi:hypothetical protein